MAQQFGEGFRPMPVITYNPETGALTEKVIHVARPDVSAWNRTGTIILQPENEIRQNDQKAK